MAAIAAPALAFGPPGWAVFGLAALGTLAAGALVVAESRSISRDETKSKPVDATIQTCANRPWSVRVHAQGTDIGGTTGSTIGAPPIVQMMPILASQGVILGALTYGMLTSRQQKNLSGAYEKSIAFIGRCPPSGYLGSKSFYGLSRDDNRFDVDSYGCSPNFIG